MNQLAGVRVIDFSQALSGPYCTLMLADLGADVLKIENPQAGDDARHWGPPFVGNDAAYFMAVNRNKRSVACDLKDPEALRAILSLTETADVVVENWRPGTAARLGVGAEQLRAVNPRLVYCSISGYGQDLGPRSGYDQIIQGTSGVMPLTGPQGVPTKWGVPIGDIAAGIFAATSVVAVLFERQRTGTGRTIDIAMQDSLVAMLTHHAARYLHTGTVPPSDHNGHSTIAPYGTFQAADGFVNVCVGNDSQFQRLCRALQRPDLATDPRYATNPLRVTANEALRLALDATFEIMKVDEIITALNWVGVPVGPVHDLSAILNDPATVQRKLIMNLERSDVSGARVVNTPWKIDGQAAAVRIPPPHLGEHTTEVLGRLSRP